MATSRLSPSSSKLGKSRLGGSAQPKIDYEALLAASQKEQPQKVGALTRVINLLSSFEPGGELTTYVRQLKEGASVGEAAGTAGKQYVSEMARGLGSVLPFLDTITKPEDLRAKQEGFTALLEELDVPEGEINIGGRRVGSLRGAAGLAGDIVLDPGNLFLAGLFKAAGKGVKAVAGVTKSALERGEIGAKLVKQVGELAETGKELFIPAYKARKVAPDLVERVNAAKRIANIDIAGVNDEMKALQKTYGKSVFDVARNELETDSKVLSTGTQKVVDLIKRVTGKEKALNLRRADILNYFPRQVISETPGMYMPGMGRLKTGIGGAAKPRSFKTLQEGKEAGYKYEEAPTALFNRLTKSVRATEGRTALNEIVAGQVRDLEGNPLVKKIVKKQILPGHVPVVIDKQGVQIGDKLLRFYPTYDEAGRKLIAATKRKAVYQMPQEAAEYLAKVQRVIGDDEAVKKALEIYDNVTNIWKGSVTSIFPAFHVRNTMGNIFNNFVGGVYDPKNYTEAAEVMKGTGQLPPKFKKLFPSLNTFEDLRKIMGYAGVTGEGQFAVDSSKAVEELLGAVPGKLEQAGKLVEKPFEIGRKLGQSIEDNARVAHFLNKVEKGMSVPEAAKSVNKFLFDYSELSQFEREVLKRIFPFYCVPDFSQILTATGWKTVDQIKVGEKVLTYSLPKDQYEWESIKKIAVFNHDEELMSWENKRHKILFTPNHRWIVKSEDTTVIRPYGIYRYPEKTEIIEAHRLNKGHHIFNVSIFKGKESILTPKDARLLGWLLTDGYFRWKGGSLEAVIYQSPKKFLSEVIEVAGGVPRKPHLNGTVCVPVLKENLKNIKKYLGRNKQSDNWVDVVSQLSQEAIQSMYDAMYKADGNTKPFSQKYFACQLDGVGQTFEVLATLLGKRVVKSSRGYTVSESQRIGIKDGVLSKQNYFGRVWCPQTENGTWVMKQGKLITITGNTFTRKNIPLQVEQILKQPAKYAAVMDAMEELRTGDLTEEEKRFMPDYIKDTFGVGIGRGPTGEAQFLAGIGLPLEELSKLGTPIKSVVGMAQPGVKAPFEMATGYSSFYGKPIKDTSSYNATTLAIGGFPGLKQFLKAQPATSKAGDKYYRVDPERMYALKLFFGRLVSTVENVTDLRKGVAARVLPAVSGVKVYTPDIQAEKERQIIDMLKELGLLKTFTKEYVPKK